MKHSPILYQAYYCEENIWQLAKKYTEKNNYKSFVLFFSNPQKKVELWYQQSSGNILLPVTWDYHVVFLAQEESKVWKVYDLDTFLNFPVEASSYFNKTFPRTEEDYTKLDIVPQVRVIKVKEYLTNFSSDRSHMKDQNGDFLAQPPTWDIIFKKENLLPSIIDFEQEILGKVYNLFEFYQLIF